MSEFVKIAAQGAVLELVLARPERKNALTRAMYESIGAAIAAAQANPAVSAIVIAAEGDVFCAGNDIADFAAQTADGALPGGAIVMLEAMAEAEKPIIAAVQGRAVGVGATMLLHCDLAFIAETASITAPFADLGLTPENAASVLLPRLIGHQRAFAVFALGAAISAEEAVRFGLAYKALPAADVRAAALEAGQALARRPLGALTATKRLMRDSGALKAIIAREAEAFGVQMRSPEAQAAFAAFLNRGKPR